MNLERVLSHLRTVPEDQKERLVEAVLNYFPILVNLVDSAHLQLLNDWCFYIQPAAEDWARSYPEEAEAEPLDADIQLVIKHCTQIDDILEAMFAGLVATPSIA